ncbi:hypothetical protein ACGF7U_15530 [Micromonospora sp. NPDC047670]|uniref:hypothetical protein n=1 Tax=Micromonospora sp. NPDC047670 TaxID=3364252 RepID=UPI00371484C7
MVLIGAVVGAAALYPTVAATTCPACYGMRRVEANLFVGREASDEQRQQVVDTVAAADQRIRAFYGGRESSPRILACPTEDCYQRIGGGRERGVAVLNRAVILSPRGLDPVIAAHEMSHVELHRRLDSGATVPQWFDEGLAVVVSDDRRYLHPRPTGDRCTAQPGGALPQTLNQWLAAANTDERIYARAACAVHRWIEANDGPQAVLNLVTRLNSGDEFSAVVPGQTAR